MNDKEKRFLEVNNALYITKLTEKAFRTIEMYNPNLVSNLSREAYDLYTVRKDVAERILAFTEKLDKNQAEVREYLKSEIKAVETLLEKEENPETRRLLEMKIGELKEYL